MIFDLRTIFLTNTLAFAVCSIVTGLIWYQSRNRIAGIGFLTIDFIMQTTALPLVMYRNIIPDILSIGMHSILVMLGSIIGYMGLERLVGKISSQRYNFCFFAVFSAAFISFSFIKSEASLRVLIFSLGTLVIWSQCAWLLLVRTDRDMRSLTRWIGVIFVALSLVNIIRIVVSMVRPPAGSDFFNTGIKTALAIEIYMVLFICLTLALILTVNKQLIRGIRQEEEKFTKAFQYTSQAILISDFADGRIVEVNHQFEYLSGYTYHEAVGKTDLDLELWASREDRNAVAKELIEAGHIRGKESLFRARDGRILIGILHIEILLIDGKKFILISMNDITRRKKAEELLERLNLTLQERVNDEIAKRLLHERLLVNQSRLASMGMMIGAIAHQWRQPLSTLSIAVQRFHSAGSFQKLTPKQLDEFKATAMQLIRYMSDTVEEFTSFHQPEKERIHFELTPCIAGAVNLFAPQFRADGITLDLANKTGNMQYTIYGYPNELKQVIVNLISNARYAILDRRQTDETFTEGLITIRILPLSDNQLAVDVEDNGCGVPDEIAPKLFDSYFTTRQSDIGTGIGLYLSQGIVEGNLSGHIYLLRGQPGATFRIELPWRKIDE